MTKPAILAFTFSVLAFTMFTAGAVEEKRFIDKAKQGGTGETGPGSSRTTPDKGASAKQSMADRQSGPDQDPLL